MLSLQHTAKTERVSKDISILRRISWAVVSSYHCFEQFWPLGTYLNVMSGVLGHVETISQSVMEFRLQICWHRVWFSQQPKWKWRQLSCIAFFLLLFLRLTEYRRPMLHQPTGCVKSNFLSCINVCFFFTFLKFMSALVIRTVWQFLVLILFVFPGFFNRNCMHISSDGWQCDVAGSCLCLVYGWDLLRETENDGATGRIPALSAVNRTRDLHIQMRRVNRYRAMEREYS